MPHVIISVKLVENIHQATRRTQEYERIHRIYAARTLASCGTPRRNADICAALDDVGLLSSPAHRLVEGDLPLTIFFDEGNCLPTALLVLDHNRSRVARDLFVFGLEAPERA